MKDRKEIKGFPDRSKEVVGNIYHFGNVYALDKNLGNAYNAHMALLPNDNDWGVITDADTMFLINTYGHQIAEVIRQYPDAGLISCLASRTGTGPQKYRKFEKHGMSNKGNMIYHRKIAEDLQKESYDDVKQVIRIAGFLMAIRKSVWETVGGFKIDCGIPSVDRNFCKKLNTNKKKIYIMNGLYILHYYRLSWGGVHAVKHIV